MAAQQQAVEVAQQQQVQRYQQRLSEQNGRVEELEASLGLLQAELVALGSNLHTRHSSAAPASVSTEEAEEKEAMSLPAEQPSVAHSRTASALGRQAMVEHALELVRDELRQERRRMAVLQDRLAQCVCESSSSSSAAISAASTSTVDQPPVRRRLFGRTMSLPASLVGMQLPPSGSVSFRRASLLPMRMTSSSTLLFSSIYQSVTRTTVASSTATATSSHSHSSLPPSTLPSTHPLHEATAELRSCYRMLQSEYSDCVESKLQLARAASSEVDLMRDELNAVRREEWERVLAVDKVQRRRRRGEDGWHEAREYEHDRPADDSKCSIM